MTEQMIKIDDLVFDYVEENSRFRAIDHVTLELNRGEYIAIIGHNGSGKSTLAKHMNAVLLPTQGDVFVDGMNTKDKERVWDIRQRAGMVFQNPDNQMVATIVEEDVAFGPENLGIEKTLIRKRVDDALDAVGMRAFARKAPHMLSGGQKQRVAIAGIIAMQPQCIILDEATAMLDPSGRKEVIETVTRLNKELGITLINITHFMEEAIHADRVYVMNRGKIVLEGNPREIFEQVEVLHELGLDVPQMTELSSELRADGVALEADILSVEEMVEALCQLKSNN